MEGLRAAPWFREFSRRKEIGIDDCAACKASRSVLERQASGCGYEQPGNATSVWQPPADYFHGEPLKTCAGYTVNLPEVTEAALARAHWKHGAVRDWCGDDAATEELLNAILIIDGAYSAVEHWMSVPKKDGGGGK